MAEPLRFEGAIKSWDAAKGFGFLTPSAGGQDIFVHISALPREASPPVIGQKFTFAIELNKDGKKRATSVRRASGGGGRPLHIRPEPTLQAKNPIGRILVAATLLAIGIGIYSQGGNWLRQQGQTSQEIQPSALSSRVARPAIPQPQRSCDGRTHCSQMTSCAEAKFFLASCPGVQMDGNNDGTPCEQQWCTNFLAP